MFRNSNKIAILLLIIIFSSCQDKQTSKVILKEKVISKIAAIEGDVAVAFYNLSDKRDSLLINADEKFHAASTMKVPVMIELFKQQNEGKLNLNDSIVLVNEFKSIVDGSLYGMDIQDDSDDIIYNQIGSKVKLQDLLFSMITVSSNLATNVLIELVDAKKVTASMRTLGAKNIEVLRGVEDQKAFDNGLNNSTTARDLMVIMAAIAAHKAGTKNDCEAMISVLMAQEFNDMIPLYLPKEIKIAHKTGTITGVHHDAAIVYLPDGREYVLVLLSKNLKDTKKGTEQLAEISKLIFDYMMNDLQVK